LVSHVLVGTIEITGIPKGLSLSGIGLGVDANFHPVGEGRQMKAAAFAHWLEGFGSKILPFSISYGPLEIFRPVLILAKVTVWKRRFFQSME
jgi:hypothetical protein